VEAARRIGLRDFVGRDVQSVLAALIDLLAPEGALLEEAAARAAVIETMTELFDALDVETTGMDALDHLSEADLAKAFELSICNVIEARFTQELAHRVERSAMDETEANRTLSEIRDHIRGIVALDLEGVSLLDVDWRGTEGTTFIETWLSAAYAVLEEGE
jgi:inactivated superfamily I helicase